MIVWGQGIILGHARQPKVDLKVEFIMILVFLFILLCTLCNYYNLAISFLALRLCKEVFTWRSAY